ncbi:MAG TPA: hypothetical protein PLL69_07880 [Gemmatimonadales bacterium]|nr:hypothetical protein [Gemmatimonadales bacterium]
MTDSGLPQRSGSFRAVVQSGTTVTAYLRIGRGRPVLLLRHGSSPLPAWDALLETLSDSWRVVAPEVPVEPSRLGGWLTGFLDGLGLADTAAVADPALSAALLTFVRTEPQRISRLVVLTSGHSAPPEAAAAPIPCQVLDLSLPAEDLVAEAAWFLSGAPDRLDTSPQ